MDYKEEYKVSVKSKKMLNDDTAFIEINCPVIAASAVPGQFVNISCSHFLKRPFGIASVNREEGTFSIGVKAVGKGSSEIAAFEAGQALTVLGPLGNGFSIEKDKSYILVSGGTGVFPVNFLYESLKESGKNFTVVQGFREKDQVIMNKPEFILTTDKGDAGIKGNCCDGLDTLDLTKFPDAEIICVGPLPMMKAVGRWAESKSLKCYVSMEQRMACGIGICLVCVCKLKAEAANEEFKHVRCCKEGPVFPYEEVIW